MFVRQLGFYIFLYLRVLLCKDLGPALRKPRVELLLAILLCLAHVHWNIQSHDLGLKVVFLFQIFLVFTVNHVHLQLQPP